MEQKGSDFWVKLTCVHHFEGRMPRVEVTSATFNYWKSSFLAINIDDSLIIVYYSLLSMQKKSDATIIIIIAMHISDTFFSLPFSA